MTKKNLLKRHKKTISVLSAIRMDCKSDLVDFTKVVKLPFVSDIVEAYTDAHKRYIDVVLVTGVRFYIASDFFLSDFNEKIISEYLDWYCKNKHFNKIKE